MSPISYGSTLRSLAAAGILSAAALPAPTAAHAQTSFADHALLNRVTLTPGTPASYAAPWRPGVPIHVPAVAVTGERALLARTGHGPDFDPAGRRTAQATLALPVDGARALLGRWSEGGRP